MRDVSFPEENVRLGWYKSLRDSGDELSEFRHKGLVV